MAFALLALQAFSGCAHQVSWEVQPVPSYALPSLDVSVVAGDRACKRVADELANTLSARPGVVVRPDAPQRLELRECTERLDTTLEMESNYLGLTYDDRIYTEQRRYSVRGVAGAEMVIVGDAAAGPIKLVGKAERKLRGPWVTDGDLDLPRTLSLRDGLRRDLAMDLADQLAPLPETIRRTIYKDPEPGTARQLHNEAVEAERAGDLDRALELAKSAYAAEPSPARMRLIEELQAHAQSVGYAFRQP
jgi:hypothetical protein